MLQDLCRKIINNLSKSTHQNKEELSLFMTGTETEEQETEKWLNMMDGGGLYHVNDNTYHFFYQVELCLREFFNFRRVVSGDLLRRLLNQFLEVKKCYTSGT